MRRKRPELRLELGDLGHVNPFRLRIVETPRGSGSFYLEEPGQQRRATLERTGMSVVGAGQALMSLSLRWMMRAGRGVVPSDDVPPPFGEVRLVVRRREARLMASLLRRHLRRLPEPPAWMPEFQRSLEEIDGFLRWEED